MVREAVSDTGPILHLHEIGLETVLSIFECLVIPELVAEELQRYGLDVVQLDISGLKFSVMPVAIEEWQAVVHGPEAPAIQPADAQVFVLAQAKQFQYPVLTDDLALRRHLETHEAVVVGSVGVLVRAYKVGHFQHSELERAVDASTLAIFPAPLDVEELGTPTCRVSCGPLARRRAHSSKWPKSRMRYLTKALCTSVAPSGPMYVNC